MYEYEELYEKAIAENSTAEDRVELFHRSNRRCNCVIREDKMETIKNKIVAVILLALGIIPIILEQDATFFVFSLFVAVALFKAKKNYID